MAEVNGDELYALVARLYPILRSITGDGVRKTLAILGEVAPLEIVEVASGTSALDWTVPPEWNVREAFIAGPDGRRVVDVRDHALHLVSYSAPVRTRMPLQELRKHLHVLDDQPGRIPYRTSYYEPAWGFCLTKQKLDSLPEGEYEVCVDSTLAPGRLTWGEAVLRGTSDEEVLISAHVCHPQLADDNCSGMAIAAHLARSFAARRRRLTLRFLFAPGTIGALAWLERNRDRASRIRHGLTLTCLGDAHPFTWKRTFAGDSAVDRAAAHVLAHSRLPHQVIDFFPYGYDERQYNAPGFRLPVGSLMRGRHGKFPEYHTSGDDLSFVRPERLEESFRVASTILTVLDGDGRYRNLQPYGEPQLGRRGLYRALGGTDIPDLQLAMLWVLNLSDGSHSLLDAAERSGLPFLAIRAAADLLEEHGLLEHA